MPGIIPGIGNGVPEGAAAAAGAGAGFVPASSTRGAQRSARNTRERLGRGAKEECDLRGLEPKL